MKSVKIDGKKCEHKEIRHMNMTVSEAFFLFVNQFPNLKIKHSKFFVQHVLLVSETPHNVCVCRYHANFQFLIDSTKHLIGFPKNVKCLIEDMTCNTSSEICMTGQCAKRFDDIHR